MKRKVSSWFQWVKYQSAYRKGHSTETALLEILNGVYTAADDKQVTVLISLDLSAAFDTADHEVLLQRLQSDFGVTDTPFGLGSVPI